MIIPDDLKKFFNIPEDCPKYDIENPDYRCMVNGPYRKRRAYEQIKKDKCSVEMIIEHSLYFLSKIGIKTTCINCSIKEIDYDEIKSNHNLNNKGHIVWMKFIKDGHLGVVASGSDVNFGYEKSSGKLIASINKEWNKDFVLLFPLSSVNDKERYMAERGLGNYLISKGIPIVDYYSHNL